MFSRNTRFQYVKGNIVKAEQIKVQLLLNRNPDGTSWPLARVTNLHCEWWNGMSANSCNPQWACVLTRKNTRSKNELTETDWWSRTVILTRLEAHDCCVLSENVPNCDGNMKVRTEMWLSCTVTPLIHVTVSGIILFVWAPSGHLTHSCHFEFPLPSSFMAHLNLHQKTNIHHIAAV